MLCGSTSVIYAKGCTADIQLIQMDGGFGHSSEHEELKFKYSFKLVFFSKPNLNVKKILVLQFLLPTK